MSATSRTLLIISQVYVPDPASVGQHMHDVAGEMARRGHRVIVYTARAGYADPTQRYPRREHRDGVEIHRLPLASFGKGSMAARLIGGLLFVVQAIVRGLLVRDLGAVLVSTSPPMAAVAGLTLRALRRTPMVFWVMDINPDQMIAMGKAKPGALAVRAFDAMMRRALARADRVVTLDRFMRGRLNAKYDLGERVALLPPWPPTDPFEPISHADNPFRRAHNLDGKLVLMYSGNLSPAHPMTTLLEAAKRLHDSGDAPEIVLMFIGDGLARGEIETFIKRERLSNVRLLPYQPFESLRFSLSAADVHLVAMGEAMVGIVHPCKLYGAMAVARPVLLLGPARSHAGEIIEQHDIGWRIDHGDVDGAVTTIRHIAQLACTEPEALRAMGERARHGIDTGLSRQALCARMCDMIEQTMRG